MFEEIARRQLTVHKIVPRLVGLRTWRLNIRAVDPKCGVEVTDFVLNGFSSRSYTMQLAQVAYLHHAEEFLTVEKVSPMISRCEFLRKYTENDGV
jgi:hypothetical protein